MRIALCVLLLLAACRGDRVHRVGELPAESEPESAASLVPGRGLLGEPAPDFELRDLNGETVRLSDYRGNRVVIEWLSPACPFTEHSHTYGSLKDLARRTVEKGVIWIAINSSGAEKTGGGVEETRAAAERWQLEHPVLLDPDGEVGRLFDATTTPEFFVVDERGVLVYVGALDNAPFGKVRGGGEVVNFVEAALADLQAGREVAILYRQSYGCRVKYAQPVLNE